MTIPNEINSEVRKAIEEIQSQYPDSGMTLRVDGEGGCYVIVESVPLSDIYAQTETWIGFRITFQYPAADVYPHFVRGDLTRVDSRELGDGTAKKAFEGREAFQLSRRSNHLNPTTDTALLKLEKVLHWLRTHP